MVVILLLATALRVYALEADMPLHISLSQGPTMDGAVTIGAGRNMAQFGKWNPYGDPSDLYHLFPAMSWLSYALFSMLGVGYWQANLLSVVTGILALAFTAAYAREQFGRRTALLTSLFIATSYLYLMYNRNPVVYTTLTFGVAAALYFWQRGLRQPVWFFFSGLATAFSILFIKILGLVVVPAVLIGLAMMAWRSYQAHRSIQMKPVLLFGLGTFVTGGLWLWLIFGPQSEMMTTHFGSSIHSFEPSLGLEENIRFAIQSVLQFGVRSGFFVQMLPLFVLAYLYTLVRGLQMLAADRPRLDLGEIVALSYLLGTVFTLLLSANRPTRYLIVLIPPMSLVAGLALDRGLRLATMRWPASFSRWLVPLMMLGLAYLFYQLLAALNKILSLLRYRTGLADARVIADGAMLSRLVAGALIVSSILAFVFLWQAQRNRGRRLTLPSKRVRLWIAIGLVVSSLLVDGGQYLAWARAPQYSIVEASRQAGQDLGEGTILGGSYAYPLAIENQLPAVLFYGFWPAQVVSSLSFNHFAVEAAGLLNNGPYNDEAMQEGHPELMRRAKLVGRYTLRGYSVNIYEIEE